MLIELYHVLVNKQKVPAHLAAQLVGHYAQWSVVDSNLTLVQNAIARTLEQRLSISDVMVIKTANRCGVDVLISEDMSHGERYGATLVVNPFL